METKTIYEILTDPEDGAGIPCTYSHFKNPETAPANPPYIAYKGNGQSIFTADNTCFWKRNNYTVELYFREKNEELEERIERLLVDNGYLYDKSGDIYIESMDVYVIYYTI